MTGYVERHHVVPRCIRLNDDTVALTPEEHYLAHLLLVKMHPGIPALLYAACAMAGKTNPNRRNKVYGWMRRELSVLKKGVPTGSRNNGLLGKIRGPYKTSVKGRVFNQEHREKLRDAKLGVLRGAHSQSTKDKMRAAALGRVFTEEHRLNLSVAKIGNQNRSIGHGNISKI